MKRNAFFLPIAAALSTLTPLFGQNPTEKEPYLEPNFGIPIFESDQVEVQPADRYAIEQLLIEVAKDMEMPMGLRSKAMAYAFAIGGGTTNFRETNFHLAYGVPFPGENEPVFADDIAIRLKPLLEKVTAADKSANQRASAFLEDIGGDIAPASFPGQAQLVGVDWDRFIPGLTESTSAAGDDPGEPLETTPLPRSEAKLCGVFFANIAPEPAAHPLVRRWNFIESAVRTNPISARVGSSTGPASIQVTSIEFPPELRSAFGEMVKMFSLRRTAIPAGNDIFVTMENGYSGADGPTAVLSCALLVDSLANDYDLDPRLAAVGDLNADGSVQPVFFIAERAVAAMRDKKEFNIETDVVELLAIPDGNAAALGDLLLNEGLEPLLKTQIFTVKTFDDAVALARAPADRDEKLQSAIDRFAEIQKALDRPNAASFLRNAEVRTRLKEVVDLAPNHASAKMLLLASLNRHPKKYTLSGSLKEIQHVSISFMDRPGRSPRFKTQKEAMAMLKKNQNRFHPATGEWVQAILNVDTLNQRMRLNLSPDQKSELNNQIKQAKNRVQLELDKLKANPEAQEILMNR